MVEAAGIEPASARVEGRPANSATIDLIFKTMKRLKIE
jgi:hypothetical protein